MKKLTLVLASFLSVNQVFAAGAVSYSCLGKDQISGQPVVFSVEFTDHAREVGYTNQSIQIKKVGYKELEAPLVLQMFDANADNNCKETNLGETYFAGKFTMEPSVEGSVFAYDMGFQVQCGKDKTFSVLGSCLFD